MKKSIVKSAFVGLILLVLSCKEKEEVAPMLTQNQIISNEIKSLIEGKKVKYLSINGGELFTDFEISDNFITIRDTIFTKILDTRKYKISDVYYFSYEDDPEFWLKISLYPYGSISN